MIRAVEIFFRRKVRQYFKFYYKEKDGAILTKTNFVIISKNCWGGQVYEWLNLPYNTPFVGLFLCAPCYIKLLSKFEYYMAQSLTFIEKSKYTNIHIKELYPIGMLDDVEIHFQHYATKEEVVEKWTRRTKRMLEITNFDDYYFTFCDRRNCTSELMRKFHALPYKNKLSFSLNTVEGLVANQHVKVYDTPNGNRIMVQNGKKLFKLTFLYVDLVHWINKGKVKRTRFKA